MNSISVNHFALFHPYRCGMKGRTGNPCWTEIGLPFILNATIESSTIASSNGTGAVYPSTQWNITHFASGLTLVSAAIFWKATPSHTTSFIDHEVTQWKSRVSFTCGSASRSLNFKVSGFTTNPLVDKVQLSRLIVGTPRAA